MLTAVVTRSYEIIWTESIEDNKKLVQPWNLKLIPWTHSHTRRCHRGQWNWNSSCGVCFISKMTWLKRQRRCLMQKRLGENRFVFFVLLFVCFGCFGWVVSFYMSQTNSNSRPLFAYSNRAWNRNSKKSRLWSKKLRQQQKKQLWFDEMYRLRESKLRIWKESLSSRSSWSTIRRDWDFCICWVGPFSLVL